MTSPRPTSELTRETEFASPASGSWSMPHSPMMGEDGVVGTSAISMSESKPTPGSRQEKSLGILTSKFVHLLQTAPNGVLDLKTAADKLAVRQKVFLWASANLLNCLCVISFCSFADHQILNAVMVVVIETNL